MVGDLGEDPSEPGLRIDVVELGGFDENEGDCHGFAAALGACEHPVFPADGDGLDRAFGCVVVELQVAALKVWPRLWHPAKGDGLGQWRLARDLRQLGM